MTRGDVARLVSMVAVLLVVGLVGLASTSTGVPRATTAEGVSAVVPPVPKAKTSRSRHPLIGSGTSAVGGVDLSAAGSTTPERTRNPATRSVSAALSIPALGVQAPVARTRIVDGALGIPDDVRRVGWDTGSPAPGSRTGTTLIAGHRDNAAGERGSLYDLADLKPGDTINVRVRAGARLVRYRVTGVEQYAKAALPPEIVALGGPHRLALVTCGGPLVRGADGLLHYSQNVVAWASPVRG